MSDQPSNFQKAITGEWHGTPSLFEPDGTHVGWNKISRESSFDNGRTTYWMETGIDAVGELRHRFDLPTKFEFGVIDSDQNRIYTGPDFVGSGRPFGTLVDSYYYSPGWNVNLRTVNQIIPEMGIQAYSSQMFEADTLVCVFNGLYINTPSDDKSPETLQKIADWQTKERAQGGKQFVLPPKHEGTFSGEFEVYNNKQELVGTNKVTVKHRPLNLLHTEQEITIEGVINKTFKALRTRNKNRYQFHGPDVHGNATTYGRYLYATRHFYGEPGHMWSREIMCDDDNTLICAWQFFDSGIPQYMTHGVLRWEEGEQVLKAQYID
ncbi:hypothetical protein [Oceanicoccus sagamiensis]|uniref:Uncharacterized protein n=1 Tax=Oceanicoccus sagamiensis TaxID=716816 RepID=A0A1X9N7R2_9GAMM|nr:hypothetical protein [Oceanicoccus sagamiensis]ARN74108.1 hypothetical protein BST96_08220 [Oceanicoccus sagamiensis]